MRKILKGPKALALLLAAIMAFSLYGCGEAKAGSETVKTDEIINVYADEEVSAYIQNSLGDAFDFTIESESSSWDATSFDKSVIDLTRLDTKKLEDGKYCVSWHIYPSSMGDCILELENYSLNKKLMLTLLSTESDSGEKKIELFDITSCVISETEEKTALTKEEIAIKSKAVDEGLFPDDAKIFEITDTLNTDGIRQSLTAVMEYEGWDVEYRLFAGDKEDLNGLLSSLQSSSYKNFNKTKLQKNKITYNCYTLGDYGIAAWYQQGYLGTAIFSRGEGDALDIVRQFFEAKN